MEPFCIETAIPLVKDVVRRKIGMFAPYPDLGFDDLVQEGLERARAAHTAWDPKRGKYSTFIEMAVGRRLIDIQRSRKRGLVRDQSRAVVDWVDAGDSAGLPGGNGGNDETLEDWLGGVYRQAVRTFHETPRRGRRWYSVAQRVSVVLLMRHRHWTLREAEGAFRDNADLRAAVCLRRIPSHQFFHRAEKFVTENLKIKETLFG